MKKLNVLKLFAIALVSVGLLGLSACQQGQKKEGESGDKKSQDKEVLILYPNWSEGIAFTHLAKAALADVGIEADIKAIEPGPIYASLAKGDADLFMDAWLPHTHSDYWNKYGDQINKLGESFSGGTTGLVVPQYVDIESITELNDVKEKFDGKIIGIGSGAGIHGNTEEAIKKYELDYKQITSSGSAMMASLKKAYTAQEPIVITGWKPHHMWADFDLKYLEDPKGVYPEDVCAIVSRTGFDKDYPEITHFMKNFNLKETQLYNLMDAIEKGDDAYTAVQQWYEDHKVLVQSWFPEAWKK